MRKQVNEIVKIVAESLPKKIKVLETVSVTGRFNACYTLLANEVNC